MRKKFNVGKPQRTFCLQKAPPADPKQIFSENVKSCLKVTEQLFFALFFSNFSPLYEGWLDALAGSYKGSLIYLLWLKCAKPQLTACLEGIERVSTTTQWDCCKFEKSVPFESIKNIRTKYIKHLVYFQLRFSRNIF